MWIHHHCGLFFTLLASGFIPCFGAYNSFTDLPTDQINSAIPTDAREGEPIVLNCRFNPQDFRDQAKLTPFWRKRNRTYSDFATFNEEYFDPSYDLRKVVNDGRYDLTIKSASYDRHNYRYECGTRQPVTGREIIAASYNVTILTPAGPPRIVPSSPEAREGEPYRLRCLSEGGSPDPEIQWTRNGVLLQADLKLGERRDIPTESILTINPTIEDHLAIYTCKVWNRAMKDSDKLERSITLNVNYAPRVEVGPFNPLMVLQGSDPQMTCTARANPSVISIEWYKDGKIISREPNHTIIQVGPSDSGVYSCRANNGVRPPNEMAAQQSGRLTLSVQYAPIVNLVSTYEAKVGDSIRITCDVKAEPAPYSIVWTREDDPQIIHTGDVLTLDNVSPYDAGRYSCIAKNKIKPSGSNYEIEKSSRSSVSIRVKHAPGQSSIVPADPVAVAGRPFTLTCSVKPPGYPKAKYRWWKENQELQELSTTENHTFLSVHSTHEGRYSCQPYNQVGEGSIASVYLTVREPPSIILKMPPLFKSKQGARGTSLTCKARAKPRPSVMWLHNGQEINSETLLHRIETQEFLEDRDVYRVESTLYFESATRGDLTAADRGKYECVFQNDVGYPAKSETYLRIEHSPILQHAYNKVAFDVGETAVLECKMSAYPEPRFEWSFESKPLGLESRYFTNITEKPNDLWIGTLVVRDVRASDYGDYTCRAWNSVDDDDKKTNIRLVAKSAPEAPRQLEILETMSDSVTLRWTEGFNGGFVDTEFLVSFSDDGHRWRNESCRTMNPCKILGLESQRSYRFKIMAINPRGQSVLSEEIRAQTKVNPADIPSAAEGYFDSKQNLLTFRVDSSALKLLARIEHYDGNTWSLITTAKVRNQIEAIQLSPASVQIGSGSYGDMRIILCLQSNDSWCGYPLLVKMDVTYLREAGPFISEYCMALLFILFAIVCVALTAYCCCRKGQDDKVKKSDCQIDSDNNRNKVPSISPPYYSGHDNNGLVTGSDDTNKISPPPMYTSTNMNPSNGHIPQNYYLTGDDGVVPSPSGTNETVHSDAWMMKNDHMNDIIDSGVMGYHTGYGTTPMDPNAFTYAYYSQGSADEYQPLGNGNDGNYNIKNSLYSPCYDDSMNAYGSTLRPNMMNVSMMDPQMLTQMDVSKINHLSFDDEPSYGGSGNRSDKMIKEIIV